MGVKINTGELLKILKLTPVHHNIMLVGKHGVGKSQIINNYGKAVSRFKKLSYRIVVEISRKTPI